jgi:vacuolar-type H+-ATPase subunit C/Vma6
MLKAVGKYSFVNAKIRARLSSLLARDIITKLVEARDLSEFQTILAGTPYEAIFTNPEAQSDPKLAERLLVEEEVQWHADIIKALKDPERALIATLLERYELENLKVALRVREGDRDKTELAYVVRKRLPNDLPLDEIATAHSFEEVFPLLAGTPYLAPVRKSLEAYKQKGTLFPVEFALELDFYRRIQEKIDALSRDDRVVARKLLGIEIDLRNIGWLVRLKFYYGVQSAELIDYLIPGGYRLTSYQLRRAFVPDSVKDVLTVLSLIILEREFGLAADLLRNEEEIGKLYLIEVILSKYMLIEIRKALEGYPFTIGTVLGYLILKRTEIHNLVTILNGKLLNLDKAGIEKHLRSA